MLIYIAGKYTAPTIEERQKNIDAAINILNYQPSA
jgi:hypothetical protein